MNTILGIFLIIIISNGTIACGEGNVRYYLEFNKTSLVYKDCLGPKKVELKKLEGSYNSMFRYFDKVTKVYFINQKYKIWHFTAFDMKDKDTKMLSFDNITEINLKEYNPKNNKSGSRRIYFEGFPQIYDYHLWPEKLYGKDNFYIYLFTEYDISNNLEDINKEWPTDIKIDPKKRKAQLLQILIDKIKLYEDDKLGDTKGLYNEAIEEKKRKLIEDLKKIYPIYDESDIESGFNNRSTLEISDSDKLTNQKKYINFQIDQQVASFLYVLERLKENLIQNYLKNLNEEIKNISNQIKADKNLTNTIEKLNEDYNKVKNKIEVRPTNEAISDVESVLILDNMERSKIKGCNFNQILLDYLQNRHINLQEPLANLFKKLPIENKENCLNKIKGHIQESERQAKSIIETHIDKIKEHLGYGNNNSQSVKDNSSSEHLNALIQSIDKIEIDILSIRKAKSTKIVDLIDKQIIVIHDILDKLYKGKESLKKIIDNRGTNWRNEKLHVTNRPISEIAVSIANFTNLVENEEKEKKGYFTKPFIKVEEEYKNNFPSKILKTSEILNLNEMLPIKHDLIKVKNYEIEKEMEKTMRLIKDQPEGKARDTKSEKGLEDEINEILEEIKSGKSNDAQANTADYNLTNNELLTTSPYITEKIQTAYSIAELESLLKTLIRKAIDYMKKNDSTNSNVNKLSSEEEANLEFHFKQAVENMVEEIKIQRKKEIQEKLEDTTELLSSLIEKQKNTEQRKLGITKIVL